VDPPLEREAIEETSVQIPRKQLLKLVPAITGMGSAGQGGYGTFDFELRQLRPNIHGLGGVSSNSTLILIDGPTASRSPAIVRNPGPIPTSCPRAFSTGWK